MTELEQALLKNNAALAELNSNVVRLINIVLQESTPGVKRDTSEGAVKITAVSSSAPVSPEGNSKGAAAQKAEPAASPSPAEAPAAPAPKAESTPKDSKPSPEQPVGAVTKQDLKDLGMKVIQADPAPKGAKVAFKSVLARFMPEGAADAPNLDKVAASDYEKLAAALRAKLEELGNA